MSSDIPLLRQGGKIRLRGDRPDYVFDVTQLDVTFNMTDAVRGRQEINIVLVLERDVSGQVKPRE